ncbi:Ztf-16 [Aphelenchoides bicaudatus]|nr:Ztf-16 [Aphelenchoides bicaudatus]
MADSACCAACGFSTNDLADFEKHVQQHEDTFTPKLDLQNLMKNQPNLMQNLPAVAANLFSSYYENNPMSQLFSKLPPSTNFFNNNLFNNGTPAGLEALFKQLPPTNIPNIEPQTAILEANDMQNADLSPKKSPKTVTSAIKKEGKSKKVLHSCPHCNFTTVMSQHMKSHLEAHDRHQGQMYVCDVCEMQFSQKANMHRHRMRHTGFKPYECKFCKKRFFRKDQCQEHMMVHVKTGDDFDCPVADCSACFRQHSALRSHLEEQHTITANDHAACKRCAMTFANPRRLLLHYQTKHEDGANNSVSSKRNQYVLNDFSDEDTNGGRDSSEPPAKRPNLIPMAKSASPSGSSEPPRNDPLDLSAFSSGFVKPSNSTADFLSSAFNWNALGLPLSVAVPQPLPVSLANTFSPQLLPKTKPPNCENLFQNFANTSLNTANLTAAFGNAQLTKFVEELKQSSRQPSSIWEHQTAIQTSNASDDHDHSSTHSPTSDSLASSTTLYPEVDDKPKEELDGEEKDRSDLQHSQEVDSLNFTSDSSFDCVHCGIQFNDYMLYFYHRNLHASDEQPWKCGLCQRDCADRFAFTTHLVQEQHSK